MTSTEQHNIDDALATQGKVLRSQTVDGVTAYYLYELVKVQKITDVAAFGTIYSVTITP